MKCWRAPVAVLAVIFSGPFLDALDARTWTSRDGKFSTEAELISFQAGKVRLRKTGTQLITVPLEKLSQADQRYVEALSVTSDSESSVPTRAARIRSPAE